MITVKRVGRGFIIVCGLTALASCAVATPSSVLHSASPVTPVVKQAPVVELHEHEPDVVAVKKPPAVLIAGRVYSVERATLLARLPKLQIAEDALQNTTIRVRCPATVSCASQSAETIRLLQLDDHGPRIFLQDRLISSLLPEDEEMAAGRHFLSAALLSGTQLFTDFYTFVAVPRGASHYNDPSSVAPEELQPLQEGEACRSVYPVSTVNGSRDLVLLSNYFDAVSSTTAAVSSTTAAVSSTTAVSQDFAATPITIEYQVVVGEHVVASGEFPHGTSAVFEHAPPGDLVVQSTCKRGTAILGISKRYLTFNPELGGAQP